ncbi:hypothetical protein CHS0354_014270 [Potamilus streckersoni]|uniref:Uncharacterized protein n=1 Tax=Potamilus streckersoni TaxID=2493646 RepID=A0AAE0SE25_9BIVA|nr:hypothetical protein CHS0354_014270 [Potamilus streckersoni]
MKPVFKPVEERGVVDAYLIVYAVDDRKSFEEAVDLLYHLRKELYFHDSIILVGNKTDLVRSRCITKEEGKEIAKTYGCKFKETSNVLNHNIDQVLCGIVKQIRLFKAKDNLAGSEQPQDKCCVTKSKSLLNKIFKIDSSSKSCENLNVL